eukprot:CAMPEP_0184436590 /NCGR_PEP_ID=MMETSP0738-20130409/549248_1 /TAXON_ID=385413 /ORGANISM="Thalassiosira miniscula, Strain CCMP1093" /LENGTH=127 /DNA_ID=CAMNT_0026803369 /DNA_START=34 /DNA_END=414 /DNA_ORIENTATION=-
MSLDRRQVLAGMGGIAVSGLPGIAAAKRSVALGASTLTSVSDGNLVLPGAFFFDGLPGDDVATILQTHSIDPAQLTPPCNLTLLQQADKTVLFDAGSGAGFMPSAGAMLDSLEALGVAPDDISHVVF